MINRPEVALSHEKEGDAIFAGSDPCGWHCFALYVVDTDHGLRVFDMDNIWKVESGDESVRRLEAATRQPITPMSFLRRDSKIRHTWIAFDCLDSPNTLLIGEFQEGDASTLILLVKYTLDYTHAGCARPA
ncbi:hypothetical protein KXV80_000931 [Aspergillus fumigatus]|nr:hypothetical protein KXV80_000931 [Aspergillus fumigatus]